MASGSRENPLQLVQFPFSAGIDEGTRDEVVEAGGGWLVLENGRQDQTGGYSTRTGFTTLPTAHIDGGAPTAGYKLIANARTPARICDNQIDVYSSAAQRWQQLAGRLPECAASLVDVPSTGTASAFEDVDATNGYLALSWLSLNAAGTYDAFLSIVDQATGGVVRIPEKVGTITDAGAPMLLGVQGNYFIAVRATTTGTKLKAWYLDTTSATTILTGWVAFGADVSTTCGTVYVVQSLPHVTTPRVAVLFTNTLGGTSRITLVTLNVGGVVETLNINTSSVTATALALGGNPTDTLWAAWDQTTSGRVLGLSPFAITTTALASTATILTFTTSCAHLGIAPNATAGKARVWGSDANVTACGYMRGVTTSGGVATADGSQITVGNAQMVRKPFSFRGRYYSAFNTYDDNAAATSQGNLIVCDWTDDVSFLRPIASAAPGLSSVGVGKQGKFAAGTIASTYRVGLGLSRSGVGTGSAMFVLDFDSSLRWQSCAWGNSVYFTGGIATCFDGIRVSEVGFLIRPSKPITSLAGGPLSPTIGYRYICVYEEVDADGNWHQSGISAPSDSTGVLGSKEIIVTTSPLTISSRPTATEASRVVRVVLYRTLDGGVAPYYRNISVLNTPSTQIAVFVDTTTDATLAANAKLYEQPGVVGTSQDKRPPPFFQCMTSYNGCLVGASGSDVWYSGQNVSGEGAWFNPVFQVPVPGDGDITAMFVQDGTLFACKRREIYAITGEAPSDNGSSGGLGLPRRLAVDVGCIESRSTCVTAFGTFFQSDRGIEILTRSQAVQWIGQPVQETLAAFPVVTSATVEPVSCCVFIELAVNQSAGLVIGGGRTLVYDLSLQKWVSIDRRSSALGVADTPSQSACMIYTGSRYAYAWMDATGYVSYGSGLHLDAGANFIAKRAVSANVKAAGFQGLQHVNKTLLLAKYLTPHDLSMSFAYDYSSTYTTPRVYSAAELLAMSAAMPNMQLEHPGTDDSRCQAIRVQLQDAAPAAGTSFGVSGACSTWIALSLEIVPQTGAYGLPDASR